MVNIPKIDVNNLVSSWFSRNQKFSRNISGRRTIKWLIGCDKKNAVETVYIPEAKRATLCISSQVGCALSCQFCATGMAGFLRNLSTAEIIGQVFYAARRIQAITHENHALPRITNIVFMGMGEPLLNEQNVFQAVNILLDDLAFLAYQSTVSQSAHQGSYPPSTD